MNYLYLASIVLSALSSFCSCLSIVLLPTIQRFGRGHTSNHLRPLILHPRQFEPMKATEKPRTGTRSPCSAPCTAWRKMASRSLEALKWCAVYEKTPALQGNSTALSQRQFQKEMARKSTEVWLEEGQARPSSGRFEGMLSQPDRAPSSGIDYAAVQ